MYTLSIILNLHREGLLVERTIRNLQHVLNFAKDKCNNWTSVEVVAILDNPDEITQEVINKHNSLFSRVEIVNYRDLADSRNHGVRCAKNNFILFADGDDYVSHNALLALFDKFYDHYTLGLNVTSTEQLLILEEYQHIAVFPKLLVEFPKLFHMAYVNSNHYIIQNNKFLHCYNSKLCLYKQVLLINPVRSNVAPYGYEDWDLNSRLLSLGVSYIVADYKLYYRKNNVNSLLSKQLDKKHTVRYSDIYNIKCPEGNIQGRNTDNNSAIGLVPHKNILRRLMRKSSFIKRIYHKYQENRAKYFMPDIFSVDKKFLLNYHETNLSLSSQISDSYDYMANDVIPQVRIFSRLSTFMAGHDIIYFFPWVTLGGADKVSIEYTRSLGNYSGCVITNIASGARINFIKLPHLDLLSDCYNWSMVSENDQLHILVKALIVSKVKIIHVVNAEPALKLIKYYANVLKEHNIKVVVSLFCPDYDWINNQYHGYPVMYPEVFANSDIILSDNNYWYDYFKTLNNGTEFSYLKLAVPVSCDVKKNNITRYKKILWASRWFNQKLVNVFLEIAQSTPQYNYIVYTGEPENRKLHGYYNTLKLLPNVEIRGEYKSLDELDFNEFDLFLYTSLFDGIPNVILEMGLSMLPIVAPNVGGISEVLGSDYYLLVKDCQDPQEYIDKINLFYELPNETIQANINKVKNYICEEHTREKFEANYISIVDSLISKDK